MYTVDQLPQIKSLVATNIDIKNFKARQSDKEPLIVKAAVTFLPEALMLTSPLEKNSEKPPSQRAEI